MKWIGAAARGDDAALNASILPAALPDRQLCRAAPLTNRFAKCLVTNPMRCQYAMPFGYTHLCGHPERAAIVDRTIDAQRSTDAMNQI
jgi:hypothetical protein